MKHYEFTGETMAWQGLTLRRIRRLADGQLGGWLESEANLEQGSDAWIGDDVKVFEQAKVSGTAMVHGYVEIFGRAQVGGDARIFGRARISGSAQIFDICVTGATEMTCGRRCDGRRLCYRSQSHEGLWLA